LKVHLLCCKKANIIRKLIYTIDFSFFIDGYFFLLFLSFSLVEIEFSDFLSVKNSVSLGAFLRI